ncbi:hypothetical protein Q7P35_010029 [Cladosporium inversicolor]
MVASMSRMKAILLCLGSSVLAQNLDPAYGDNYTPVNKDDEAISRNYPDIDIDLLSPAFLNPETIPAGFANGTSGPTPDYVMNNFLQTLASRNDWYNYYVADFKTEQGRPLPYVYLTEPTQSSHGNTTAKPKLRVYIQGEIHGNEPAGDQGIMALLGKMDANRTWTASLLERMDILILTRYNADGVHYFQRELASNIDPNRDHPKLLKQQTRDIKRAFNDYDPHVVIDMHEFTVPSIYGGRYRHGADAMIAGGKNLNTRAEIRNLTDGKFRLGIGAALEERGLNWEPYVTAETSAVEAPIVMEEAISSSTSGRNAMGLNQAVVILAELRGIRLADQHFQRRTASALTMLEAFLNIARQDVDEVLETIEGAIESFINSDDDIIMSDSQPSENRTFTFVDIRNGSLVQVPIEFQSSTPAIANQTRTRPEAYLIPRNWMDVAERLKIMGVEMEELKYEYRGAVEAYNITSSQLEDEYYEGVVRNHVTTKPFVKEDLVLPVGSWRVSTRQKKAAQAFIALEPEIAESFVSFSIIPVGEGAEYPIFREVA